MATVDEILASNPSCIYQDINDVILIDPATRMLIVPPTEIILGVVSDKDAERKYFRCARYIGNSLDLATCNIVVVYSNAAGERGEWPVDDLVYDDVSAVFSWQVSEDAVKQQGTVKFNVSIRCNYGVYKPREWNTTTATGTVLPDVDIFS